MISSLVLPHSAAVNVNFDFFYLSWIFFPTDKITVCRVLLCTSSKTFSSKNNGFNPPNVLTLVSPSIANLHVRVLVTYLDTVYIFSRQKFKISLIASSTPSNFTLFDFGSFLPKKFEYLFFPRQNVRPCSPQLETGVRDLGPVL